MANVLDPYYLTEMVQVIRTDITQFRGAQILTGGSDLKPELGLTIEYDITYDETGMTPPTGLNDESPIRHKPAIGHLNFTNQEWREKKIIDREKIAKLRAPGTQLERSWGEQYMTECMVELNQRLETRFEWLRWTSLKGSLLVPATSSKPAYPVDYKVPNSQKPTAAVLWSDTVLSDPLADIDKWKLLYRGTGAQPKRIVVNQKVDVYLKQNKKIQDLVKNMFGRDLVSADSLKGVVQQLCGLDYEVYDGGYIDDTGTFLPFIPDNVCIILGEGATGTMMDLVTSPNNYEDIFQGHVGKFAVAKEFKRDPDYWAVVNGATVLPRLKYVNWHIYATIA
ncbi:major capsid protein [Paenibacillus sp. UMB4589-SE434]|uniref:major capsid protein n=1 Tax=Paenibacillus sp. UMB4589-SE434 TaxID=3046314 RepID=UPI0025511D60|nr:major capsid protein [Paenibacillus sp. UMB4589-SE434]MDK8182107.1 major capsid protein [Paenibacillus sp. UMB4589-SE434]